MLSTPEQAKICLSWRTDRLEQGSAMGVPGQDRCLAFEGGKGSIAISINTGGLPPEVRDPAVDAGRRIVSHLH